MGAAFAHIATPSLLDSFGSSWATTWFSLLALAVSCGVMLYDIDGEDVNVVKTCICLMVMSGSIFAGFLANMKLYGETLTTKTIEQKSSMLGMTMFLTGITISALCFLSDFLYYMNRNQLIWAYIDAGAFPVGLFFLNSLLHHLTAKSYPASLSFEVESSRAGAGKGHSVSK